MQIEIQTRKFSLTRALRGHVERRLGFVAHARYDNIKRVLVRLSGINGPRGGKDKCCLIQVELPGQPDIVIEDTRSDLYAAIDRAAQRVSRTVGRRLRRQIHRSRGRDFARNQLLFGDSNAVPSLN